MEMERGQEEADSHLGSQSSRWNRIVHFLEHFNKSYILLFLIIGKYLEQYAGAKSQVNCEMCIFDAESFVHVNSSVDISDRIF